MNTQIGGELIGSGSFGCVFHPALKCENQTTIHGDMVSKIFFGDDSKESANEEIKVDKLIKKIQGYQEWSYIWDKNCLPQKFEKIIKTDHNIIKCLDEHHINESTFNKNRRMLQGLYAGKPFSIILENKFKNGSFTNKKKFISYFYDIIRLMKPLFLGLIKLYDNKLSHSDIKTDNIMVDTQGCKYIDFGLSAKITNHKFYKFRSMSEFLSDRIYPPYPYEFIYLFADKNVLHDEKEEKKYDVYRDLHDRYQLVHETMFNRDKLKHYLFSLIDRCMENDISKEKHNIISLMDTYSLGILFPLFLVRTAKKQNKIKQIKKLIQDPAIKPFINLFKDMCDPDHYNRIKPHDAYKRYLELEKLYLLTNNTANKMKKNKRTKKTH